MSAAFLRQISERDPYAIHIMIWDGASFHPNNTDARIPDNVVALKQPPYSPELNPVETLWDMRRDGLCIRRWTSLRKEKPTALGVTLTEYRPFQLHVFMDGTHEEIVVDVIKGSFEFELDHSVEFQTSRLRDGHWS